MINNNNYYTLALVLILSTLMIHLSSSATTTPPPEIFNKSPTTFNDWVEMTQQLSNLIEYSNITKDYINQFAYFRAQGYDEQELEKAAIVGITSMIPEVGEIISTMIDMVWSYSLSNTDDENFRVYKLFKQMVIDIVDNQVTLLDSQLIINKIAYINVKMDTFKSHRADWEEQKKNPNRITAVKSAFESLEEVVRSALANPGGDFRKPDYGVDELALFTQVATIHMVLLRDVVQNGKAWKFTTRDMIKYKKFYQEVPKEYQNYTIAVYNRGLEEVIENGRVHELSGSELMDNGIIYKNFMTRFVFDIVGMWFVHEGGAPFPNGFYYDNVRYLWSKAIGKLVNPSEPPKTKTIYYDYPDYTHLETFFKSNQKYKGDFYSTNYQHDSHNYIGMKSCYTNSFQGIYCEDYVGVEEDVYTSDTYYYPQNSIKTSHVTATYDILPIKTIILYDNTTVFNIFQDLDKTWRAPVKLNEWGNEIINFEIDYYYDYNHKEIRYENSTFPGHKIGAIVPHSTNWEYVTENNGDGLKQEGVVDGYYVGYLPTNVMEKRYLLPKISTMVNVQKSNPTNAQFVLDVPFPSIHSYMTLGDDSSFKFPVIPFNTSYTVFGFGVRYHFQENRNQPAPTIGIVADGMKLDTFTLLKDTPVETCETMTHYKEFKIMKPKKFTSKNVVDVSKFSDIKVNVKGANVYIHSLISYPVKKSKCTPTNCPEVAPALMETSFFYEELVPEGYVPMDLSIETEA